MTENPNDERYMVFDEERAKEIMDEVAEEICSIVRERGVPNDSDKMVDISCEVVMDMDYYDTLGMAVLSEIAEYRTIPIGNTCAWDLILEAAMEMIRKLAVKKLEEGPPYIIREDGGLNS